MRRPCIAPSSAVIFLCTALVFFLAILWSAFQPYTIEYNAVIQACAFAFSSGIYLLLNRLFFRRRLREEGVSGAREIAARRSALRFVEDVMLYSGGFVVAGLAVNSIVRMEERIVTNPVYFTRVDTKHLVAAFALCLALYFSAGFLSGLLRGAGAAPGPERLENGRAVLRVALALLALAGIVCGILANVTVVPYR